MYDFVGCNNVLRPLSYIGLMARECIERARRSVAKMINAASTGKHDRHC